MGRSGSVELVTDCSRDESGSFTVDRVTLPFPASLSTHDVERLALAAFGLVLSMYTGQTELLFDVDLATQGNGLLQFTLDPSESVADLGERIQLMSAESEPLGTPVRLVDHHVPLASVQTAELAVSIAGTELHLDFHSGLFKRHSVVRIGGHLVRAMEAMTSAPDQHVGELSLLAEGERERILGELNDTARPFPEDISIHRLFEDTRTRFQRLSRSLGRTSA